MTGSFASNWITFKTSETTKKPFWLLWRHLCIPEVWPFHFHQHLKKSNRAGEAGEANEVAEAAEVSWALKIILVLEFYDLKTNFIVLKIKLTESWKSLWILATFFSEAGQPMSLFSKLVDETQMAAPRQYTDIFIKVKKLLLGGLWGLQNNSIWYERPCIVNYSTV